MSDDNAQSTPDHRPAVGGPVERDVRPGAEAPRWWHCDTHGPGKLTAWGCPDCTAELRRWKSTHAPRLAALEGLLHAAQHEAWVGREAIATLASERAANALLTDELERLRSDADRAKGLIQRLAAEARQSGDLVRDPEALALAAMYYGA